MGKLEEGIICFFDPNNKHKQKSYGTKLVIVLNKEKKTRFFQETSYSVYDVENETILNNVEENILVPVKDTECYKKSESMILIRNPEDLPEFNIYDKIAITGALKYITGEIPDKTDMSIIINQLRKMIIKLDFYDALKEI